MNPWETVIGLEVHARLMTRTKLFCGCSSEFGAPPNSNVCPVCLGYPGALPVTNREAIALAMRMAAATGSEIQRHSVFARKNYFYPDLPKGYQISQYDRPLATGGTVPIRTATGARTIHLTRIHIEEDAGKLSHHSGSGEVSLVDLNRAGVPLIEIVSEPEIGSAEEAVAYLNRLRQILMYTGVCDGNMEEGSLRCDANVSVRRAGERLGTRAEVKNLNSFRFLSRAIEFEIARQIELLEGGQEVVQETRLFDPVAGETRSMRSKEEAHDYRYFPEPDLQLVEVDRSIEDVVAALPELPHQKAERYHRDHEVPVADAEVLVTTRELAEYFEATAEKSGNWRASTNWVRNELLGWANEHRIELAALPVTPSKLARIIELVDGGTISGKAAKMVFEEIATDGGDPDEIVEQKKLAQVSDPDVIRQAAESVIAANAGQVDQYRGGKVTVFGFLVGQLMKETRGRANPDVANRVLRELLDRG
jgi:aspartyl-tRNA(Asn)/glutamyl-tRNA(Gln) amidotransferase subunit B